MVKWISAVLVILFGIVFTFILYLSTIGIETNSFNSFVQNKLKNYNQSIVLNFSKAKLLLDLKSLNLKVKLIEPKITSKSSEIIFDKVNSIISLRSYLKNEFAIKNIELKTHKIELKKFTKFMSLVNPSPFIFILNNSINKGTIEGETELFFNQKGKLIDNYEITGSISNLEAKIIDAYKLEDINLNFKIKKDFFEFDIKDSKLFGLHFDTTKINIKKNSKDLDVLIVTNSVGKIDNIKELLNNFDYSLSDKNIDVSNLDFKLNHKINFKLKNLIKIKDLKIEGSGLIDKLLLTYDGTDKYKKYIDNLDAIAVREDDGVDLVKEISGREAKRVLDPTLLMSKEEWKEVIVDNSCVVHLKSRPYIIIYMLHESETLINIANYLKEKLGLKVIMLTKRAYSNKSYSGIEIIEYAGPAEYIELFMSASFVLTNSFHGTAFATNFNVPFFAILNPERKNNSRMINFLKMTG